MNAMKATVTVYAGERLSDYSFGADHPFGPLRYTSFVERFQQLGLERHCRIAQPVMATRDEIERFHTAAHIDRVI
jgi:acetoin utilization protein AcuC